MLVDRKSEYDELAVEPAVRISPVQVLRAEGIVIESAEVRLQRGDRSVGVGRALLGRGVSGLPTNLPAGFAGGRIQPPPRYRW